MTQSSKSNFFRDPQNIIAVGVTIISLCALIVSLIQTNILREERALMREYSRASVWPHLAITTNSGYDKDNGNLTQFGISLTNSGVGPAIITDVKISTQDSIAHNWWHLFKILEIPDSIDTHIFNSSFNAKVIKIGETIKILNLDNNLPLANALSKKLQKKGLSIEIYYESIYGEKWKYDIKTTTKLEHFDGLPKEEQFW